MSYEIAAVPFTCDTCGQLVRPGDAITQNVAGEWIHAQCGPQVKADGAAAIAVERQRQIDEEGYTAQHDARHHVDQFVQAAGAYLGLSNWSKWEIKREDGDGFYVRRNLVKAGALIAAAIDRLDRIESER